MMARRLLLPDFSGTGSPARPAMATPGSAGLSESQRLDAYEQGYSAGWEDAARAAEDSTATVSAGLAASLQDLSFTYHEAHAHVLSAVKPILIQALEKVLPAAARAALPALVSERLSELAERAGSAPMTLQVSAADEARVAAMLPADPGFPLELRVTDALAEGQVNIAAGTIEEEIDVSSALEEIARTVAEFFTASQPLDANEERTVVNG